MMKISKAIRIFNSVSIALFSVVIAACFVLISFIQYGGQNIAHTFNMDVGFFVSHVYALMKDYQIFPDSLENLGVDFKYHYFEAHCKYLLALIMGPLKASLLFSLAILALLIYLLAKGNWLKLNFLLVLFGITSPFLFYGDDIYSANHLFRSDFIQNHNTILGVLFILLWIRTENIYAKAGLALLSGFIKFPLIPAIFALELFTFLYKDAGYQKFKQEWKSRTVILAGLILSYFVFGSGEARMSIQFHIPDGYWTYIKTVLNLWWFYLPILLYVYQLFKEQGKLSALQKLMFLGLLVVPFFGQLVLIRLVPEEYYSQDNKQLYLWIYFTFTLYFLDKINLKKSFNLVLPGVFALVALFNVPYFSLMFRELQQHRYEKMSEHLDNTEIIRATGKVTDPEDIVGLNFIDNPLRKNKQLQVCAVLSNQLFVSNLLYGASSEREKRLMRKNWEDIQSYIKTGSPDLSPTLDMLLLDKRKNNFDLNVLSRQYKTLNETENYWLLERR